MSNVLEAGQLKRIKVDPNHLRVMAHKTKMQSLPQMNREFSTNC